MVHPPITKRRRALITGITGQDGSYLAELLLSKDYDVCGLARRPANGSRRIEHLSRQAEQASAKLEILVADHADAAALDQALLTACPDEIYHLAAESSAGNSFDEASTCAEATFVDTARLLEAVRRQWPKARYFQASSAEMFGRAAGEFWSEKTVPRPASPYGVAKACGYLLTRFYRAYYGMFAVNGIMFNRESPRRQDSFVTRKIARAAADFFHGRSTPLALGNLNAIRDWGFAGDYVDAIWRMMQAGQADDYVIATGQTHTVRQWCEQAFAAVDLPLIWHGTGLSEQGVGPSGETLIEVAPHFFRPLDADHSIGDASRAHERLGWSPTVSFEQLVRMMVDAELDRNERSQAA